MNRDAILQNYNKVVEEFGPWTAHQVKLAEELYTMTIFNDNHVRYVRRIAQIVTDWFGEDLTGKRFLDLGCLEGGFAIELACRGAEVVAIEARESNIAKLNFCKQVLGLDSITPICADARNISRQEHGVFDGILCLGLLYHFEFEAIPKFLCNVHEMTRTAAVFDTHISLFEREMFDWNGNTYRGALFKEHEEADSADIKEKRSWASLDNTISFFPTKESLLNLINDVGFSSSYICEMPFYNTNIDRLTVVSIRSQKTKLRSIGAELAPPIRHPLNRSTSVVDSVNRLPIFYNT